MPIVPLFIVYMIHSAFGNWNTCIGHFICNLQTTNSRFFFTLSSICSSLQYVFNCICYTVLIYDRLHCWMWFLTMCEISHNDLQLLLSLITVFLSSSVVFFLLGHIPSIILNQFSNLNEILLVSDYPYLFQLREDIQCGN